MSKKKSDSALSAVQKKYPELFVVREQLQARRDALEAEIAPHRKKHDEIAAEAEKLRAKARDLFKAKIEAKRSELAEIDTQLGALARSMGARTLSGGAPAEETEK